MRRRWVDRVAIPLADGRSWIIPVIILILSWAGSSLVGYYQSAMAMSNRMTAVEVQQRLDSVNEKDRLDRIETKLDNLFFEVTGRKP